MKLKIILFVCFIFLFKGYSFNHPHVFIYSSIDAVFDDNGLKGFNIYWKFDEMFSNMFIYDFDKNENKKLEPEEVSTIKSGGFDNLKKFDFFSHIKINKEKFKVEYIKNFKAWIEGNNLFYSFFIPCHVKASVIKKNVSIAIYDKSFYCSVFLTKNPLYLQDSEKFEVFFNVKENRKDAYYFGQILPKEITISFGLRNE
ncbi:MAG: DUF1007 family protein [Desulforegulaceae bacterium]|nr:DUF1007 family protein [Desulforegulaceae bacterium]